MPTYSTMRWRSKKACILQFLRSCIYIYRVYKTENEQIWNCSQFRKTAITIQFLTYIASNSNFVNRGVYSNKLKMACARDLKSYFELMGEKCVGCLINRCTKFQTIFFSLSPLTIYGNLYFFLKNQPFACLINAFA